MLCTIYHVDSCLGVTKAQHGPTVDYRTYCYRGRRAGRTGESAPANNANASVLDLSLKLKMSSLGLNGKWERTEACTASARRPDNLQTDPQLKGEASRSPSSQASLLGALPQRTRNARAITLLL